VERASSDDSKKSSDSSNTLRLRSFHYSLFQSDYSAAIQGCSINPVMTKRVKHRETRRHMQGRLCRNITWESAGIQSLYSKRNRDTWNMGPYAGADYDLTSSHRRLQLSTPTKMNADKCFPKYLKMEQPIE
jgi:hypothetical protein